MKKLILALAMLLTPVALAEDGDAVVVGKALQSLDAGTGTIEPVVLLVPIPLFGTLVWYPMAL